MRLLVDTDAFCKLAIGGVLDDAVQLLGADLSACGRLPALPYMLRGGKLRKLFGADMCDSLVPIARCIPAMSPAGDDWLERFIGIPAIDPGDAQIFAVAAEYGMMVLTGDKRALRALKNVSGIPTALSGRIVVFEAVLLALCDRLGAAELRRRIQPLVTSDQVVRICFSNPDSDPYEGLRSYFQHLAAELSPLVLWHPRSRGGE
jgi:hypothetical protein